MIRVCPYCGYNLELPINDGIGSCHHCYQVIDSSFFHKILSLYWLFKSYKVKSLDDLPKSYLNDEEANLAERLFSAEYLSHEELFHELKSQGVSRYIT